jgi:hypothetical protein
MAPLLSSGSIIVLREFVVDNTIGLGEVNFLLFRFLQEIHHNKNGNAEALQQTDFLALGGG